MRLTRTHMKFSSSRNTLGDMLSIRCVMMADSEAPSNCNLTTRPNAQWRDVTEDPEALAKHNILVYFGSIFSLLHEALGVELCMVNTSK